MINWSFMLPSLIFQEFWKMKLKARLTALGDVSLQSPPPTSLQFYLSDSFKCFSLCLYMVGNAMILILKISFHIESTDDLSS